MFIDRYCLEMGKEFSNFFLYLHFVMLLFKLILLHLTLHAGKFFMLLLSSADFFSKLTLSRRFFQEHYQCQTA